MNTTTNLTKRVAWLVITIGLTALPLRAADYYWNFNGDGDWHHTELSVWALTATGDTPPTAATTAADNVYFSANGITAGTVTVNGTQLANELWLNQAFNFTGGTIDLSTGASGLLRVAASGTIGSILKTKGIYFMTANQTLTLSGGSPTLTAGGQLIGAAEARATSTLELTNGSYGVSGGQFNSNIGDFATRTGGLVIAASATLTVGVSNQIGSSGEGVLRIEGGGWYGTGGGDFVVGRGNTNNVSNKGYVVLNSGTITHFGSGRDFLVGFQGAQGVVEVNGGVIDFNSSLSLNSGNGNIAGQYGEFTLNNGSATFGKIILNGATLYAINNSGSSVLNVNGGILKVGASGIVNNGGGTSTYAITLSGGTVGATAGWSSNLDMTLSNANGGVNFDTTGGNIELSGVLSGEGGFTKVGTGTLLLSGANTYEGDTVINVGTLELGHTAALGLAADLSLLSGVTVNLNYTGNATIDHLLLDGVIIDNLTINTAYTTAQLNTILGGGVDIFTGNGLLTISAIPEPSTLALLGFGIIGVLVLRRRKA
jgi:autotransporter-associated beta strand protein